MASGVSGCPRQLLGLAAGTSGSWWAVVRDTDESVRIYEPRADSKGSLVLKQSSGELPPGVVVAAVSSDGVGVHLTGAEPSLLKTYEFTDDIASLSDEARTYLPPGFQSLGRRTVEVWGLRSWRATVADGGSAETGEFTPVPDAVLLSQASVNDRQVQVLLTGMHPEAPDVQLALLSGRDQITVPVSHHARVRSFTSMGRMPAAVIEQGDQRIGWQFGESMTWTKANLPKVGQVVAGAGVEGHARLLTSEGDAVSVQSRTGSQAWTSEAQVALPNAVQAIAVVGDGRPLFATLSSETTITLF